METFSGRRRSDAAPTPPAMTALVIDDETSYRTYISALARRLGFATDEAPDGETARELLANAHYDLLVVTLDTSGISGVELIARLRADEAMRTTFAVLVTSQEDMEKKISALAAGYDEVLSKSATELEVVARIVAARRLVERQQTFDHVVRELYGLATRDELTGIFNRRFFVSEVERLLRAGDSIGIVLFDLDDFKCINDSYGHLVGDRILRDIGAIFQRCTRPEDLVARYGGDEFVMVLNDADFKQVEWIAARLVDEIRSLRWTIRNSEFRVGVTSGVASSQLLPRAILSHLLEAADRDLYKNKWLKKHPDEPQRKSGEDRVVALPEPVSDTRKERPVRSNNAEARPER